MEFECLLDGFNRAIEKPMKFTYKVNMDDLFNRPTRAMVKSVDDQAVLLLHNADKILDVCKSFETEVDRMGVLFTPEQRKRFNNALESARQKSREHRAQWRIIYKQIQYLNSQLDCSERDYKNNIMLNR
jgi:hypothetical protein